VKEYRNLLIALGVMALLTPVGLYLPRILQAGGAWGEWGIDEVRTMVGYAPAGMEKRADAWKAPMHDYAPPGGEEASSQAQGWYYLFSAFLGIIACGGAAYLLARWLTGRGRNPTDEKP
jgi:cobalt/nickel transport protein